MSDLKLHNQNTQMQGIETLSIVELLNGQKVEDASDKDLDIAITVAIEKANLDLGRLNVDEADNNHLCDTLMLEARKYFSKLSLLEIQAYIANGIRNKYSTEPVYKPTVILVTAWWNAGMQNAKRIEARQAMEKADQKTSEPTDEEKFTTGKNLCIDLFEKYKKSGQLGLSVIAVYEFLNSHKIIDKSYKEGIYKQAIEETVIEKQREITLATDLLKRRALNAQLECLTENIANDGITEAQHKEVLRTGKKIILKNWFDDLVMNETDLSEVIGLWNG